MVVHRSHFISSLVRACVCDHMMPVSSPLLSSPFLLASRSSCNRHSGRHRHRWLASRLHVGLRALPRLPTCVLPFGLLWNNWRRTRSELLARSSSLWASERKAAEHRQMPRGESERARSNLGLRRSNFMCRLYWRRARRTLKSRV